MKHLPSLKIIDEKIQMLINGIESRESISAWAISIIDDDSVKISNKLAWKIIQNLGAADLMAGDNSYLYTVEDFKAWQKELFKNFVISLD